jgi:hypothetical protein
VTSRVTGTARGHFPPQADTSNKKRIGDQFRSQSFLIYREFLDVFFATLTTLKMLAAKPPQSMIIPITIIVIALADMLSTLLFEFRFCIGLPAFE